MKNQWPTLIQDIRRELGTPEKPASLRAVERTIFDRVGERVTITHLSNLSRGLSFGRDSDSLRRMALAFPHLADRIYDAAGESQPPLIALAPLMPDVMRVAEERGTDTASIIREAVEYYLRGAGASPLLAVMTPRPPHHGAATAV